MMQAFRMGIVASAARAAAGGADPHIASVVLLLHMDGANGSTSFPDASASPKAITVGGGAAVSTAQSRFGGASAAFSGSADFLAGPGGPDLAMGSGDFTIELWAYRNARGAFHSLIHFVPTQGSGAYPEIIFTASDRLLYYTVGAERIVGATDVPPGVWHHVALSRVSGVTRLFLNGALQGEFSDSYAYLVGADRPRIGNGGWGLDTPMNGFIDELRITKGVGRYSASFTPPGAAFPDPGAPGGG